MPPINPCSNCGANEWMGNSKKNVIVEVQEGLVEGTGSLGNRGTKVRMYICRKCRNLLFFSDTPPPKGN